MGALIVVMWHLSVCFFPAAAWGAEKPTSAPWERAFHASPLWVTLSGSFAVSLFFVLSGYVLTISYFRSRDAKPLVQRIVGRPIRLGVLATASTVLFWCGLRVAPHAGGELLTPVLTATGGLDAVAPHLNLHPDASVRALFANLLWLPWFQPSDPKELYNGVLWTMHVELLGSFLAMLLAFVLSQVKSVLLAGVAYVTIGAVMMLALPESGIYFATFLLGSAIAVIDPATLKTDNWRRLVPILLAALGLFLGGRDDPELSFGPAPAGAVVSYGNVLTMALGAVILFGAVLVSSGLSKVFSVKPLVFIGRISFSLYVFHPIVIFAVGINLFMWLGPAMSVEGRSTLAAIASFLASLGLAVISTRWIDGPSIRLARSFSRAVVK